MGGHDAAERQSSTGEQHLVQHRARSYKVNPSTILNKCEQPELIYQSFALCGIWLGVRHPDTGFRASLGRGSELWLGWDVWMGW